jgi:uncharacterized protein (TIRG00374 family)
VAAVAAASSFVLVVVAALMVIRKSRAETVNAAVATLAGAAAAAVFVAVWRAQGGTAPHAVMQGARPAVFVVDTAFLAFLISADLFRRRGLARWSVGCAAVLVASGLADRALPPFAFAMVVIGGSLVGWAARWVLGVPSARPSREQLLGWLSERGLEVIQLRPSSRRSAPRVGGTLADGTPIEVRFANRDTQGSGMAGRTWALVRLRPAVASHVAVGSRNRLEQLALTCALAERAGVTAPRVLLLQEAPQDTLALVTASPAGDAPGPGVSEEVATSLFESLGALHRAGIAHRDLRSENLIATGPSTGFSNLDAAEPGASEISRRLDVAQLATTMAQAADPETAVRALRAGYKDLDETAVASVLQPIALAPWGWSAVRQAKGCLAEVRSKLVGSGDAVPLSHLERFRWRTVVSVAALAIAGYVVVGQISTVNLFGTLSQMSFSWFAVALASSAVTYWAAAVNLAAFVSKPLKLRRGFFVQLSTTFVGVTMPSTLGYVAVNGRYLARQKLDQGSIAAAITLTQVVNAATTVLAVVVLGLLTGSGLSHFKVVPGADVLIAGAVIAAVMAVLLVVPHTRVRLRRSVMTYLRDLLPKLLEAVSQPLRLAVGAGASLLLNAAYGTAFIAALLSVGAHPPILPTVIVYLVGGFVGATAPTPGGLGGVEAALAAGLTGIGIPAAQAIPAVLIFRFATFWLPIPAGWVSFLLLQRSGTL